MPLPYNGSRVRPDGLDLHDLSPPAIGRSTRPDRITPSRPRIFYRPIFPSTEQPSAVRQYGKVVVHSHGIGTVLELPKDIVVPILALDVLPTTTTRKSKVTRTGFGPVRTKSPFSTNGTRCLVIGPSRPTCGRSARNCPPYRPFPVPQEKRPCNRPRWHPVSNRSSQPCVDKSQEQAIT